MQHDAHVFDRWCDKAFSNRKVKVNRYPRRHNWSRTGDYDRCTRCGAQNNPRLVVPVECTKV